MGINANDLAISELTPLNANGSKNDDLFILSQPSEDGKTYTTYSQKRSDIFGINSAFQLANPCLRSIYLDYDPNNDPVYDGEKYWVKGGETINLTDGSSYYDGLSRLTAFLNSELSDKSGSTTDIDVYITNTQKTTIQCTPSKSGLLFTTDKNSVEFVYQKTGIAWFYLLDDISKRTTLTLPRTKWNFVGSRGNVGQMVRAGLPNFTNEKVSLSNFKTSISGDHQHRGGATWKWQGVEAGYTLIYSGITWTDSAGSHYHLIGGNGTITIKDSNIYGQSDTVQPPATQMDLWFAL